MSVDVNAVVAGLTPEQQAIFEKFKLQRAKQHVQNKLASQTDAGKAARKRAAEKKKELEAMIKAVPGAWDAMLAAARDIAASQLATNGTSSVEEEPL